MDGPSYRPVSAIPLGGRPPDRADEGAAASSAARRTRLVRRRTAALAGIGGSLLVIVCTALPWATLGLPDGRDAVRTGWVDPLVTVRWGPVVALLALVLAVALTPVAAEEIGNGDEEASAVSARIAIGAAALSPIVVVVAVIALVGADDAPLEFAVRREIGPFLMLSGALLASVGSVLAAVARPPAMVTPLRAVGAVG